MITDSIISANEAEADGGIYLSPNSLLLSVTGSTFSGNESYKSGGAIKSLGSVVSVISSTFSTNIGAYSSSALNDNTPEVYSGGAIYIAGLASTANISNSTFSNNISYGYSVKAFKVRTARNISGTIICNRNSGQRNILPAVGGEIERTYRKIAIVIDKARARN